MGCQLTTSLAIEMKDARLKGERPKVQWYNALGIAGQARNDGGLTTFSGRTKWAPSWEPMGSQSGACRLSTGSLLSCEDERG